MVSVMKAVYVADGSASAELLLRVHPQGTRRSGWHEYPCENRVV